MDPGGGSNKSVIGDAESKTTDNVVSLSAEKDVKATSRKSSKLQTSSKGVENAKKRLRAFSIQKKPQLTPVLVPKASGSTNTTVIIGKLAGVKVTPKVEPDPEQKKLKPPKPGAARRSYQDSYIELQRRTLSEIEDMKRKMELVELGIPLGLICPTSTSEKAMPTKAMPPIKSLLDPAKVDDLIREAKKAKQEGKAYKFNYQKLLPDYDNPFQKKKEELLLQHERERKSERRKSESERERDRDKRRNDKYVGKRHDYRRDSMYKERDKDKTRYDDRDLLDDKETDVNLNDYLVCDSWSLENDDKSSISSPKIEKSSSSVTSIASEKEKVTVPNETVKTLKKDELSKPCAPDSPRNMPIKIEKLMPVIDSFKFEIDPNDEFLDIFDEDSDLDKFAQQTKSRHRSLYDSPEKSIVDYELDNAKDSSMDGMNDDTFLESVINEIKQENMSDDGSQDKGLVEYEMSPNRDEESPEIPKRSSVTPEIDDKIRNQSQRSDYAEGYRSSDSFKSVLTTESGYKSAESYRLSVEKDLNEVGSKMSKSTVDSLETWSFVLKICQPLLFRHDKNKCYKETQTSPKLWYAENPKACNCVKDRSVVYEELEMLKMSLVDRVYGCDQIPDAPFPKSRKWYPRKTLYSTENNPVPLSSEWEAEDSQLVDRGDRGSACATPQRSDELTLDREYQRFMEAVWPDVVESKKETSRSTTPIRQESRKKKKEDADKEADEKKPKKLKLSSEGWSQESDMEEDKSKKHKMVKAKAKTRKRKHSTSSLSSSGSESDEDVRKRRKLLKKKAIKKAKSKSAKRRRIGRKLLKKLKEKHKRRGKEQDTEDDDIDKKKSKSKKRKQQKLKIKALKKKKVESSTSNSSSSSDSTDSDSGSRKSKKAKKKGQDGKKKIKKQRQQSSSDSTQSEDLFDVNILNNIKTERLTDDEKCQKMMDFSPRRHPSQPREIINVKELQNDFVGNIHIKQEVEDIPKEILKEMYVEIQEDVSTVVMDSVEDVKPVLELKFEDTKLDNILVPKLSPETVYPKQEVAPVPAPVLPQPVPVPSLDESNMSQTSSQESVCSVSVKDAPIFYEKDESHLRPSSQNSNYSFNDVISASQNLYHKDIKTLTANQHALYDKELEINVDQTLYSKEIETFSNSQSDYGKRIEVTTSDNSLYDKEIDVETECEDKYGDGYEAANYEMYEHMAMAYQSDVASQQRTSIEVVGEGESQRIETVVGARTHGEIKCDWRAGDAPATPHRTQRPSRWGLKPGEVNIVLTGGSGPFLVSDEAQPVYHIQSLANRTDINTGYDEAYMDMYGAADRLQYGDCFGEHVANVAPAAVNIDTVSPNITPLSVLGGIAKEIDADKEISDRGILVTSVPQEPRGAKRVSFADGYKPGQDSDIEEPPAKKRKRSRRYGCAWPCPASHPDHVPLWDALPPPPPPPGSPPPQRRAAPPLHLLRPPPRHGGLLAIPTAVGKFDPTVPMQGFMPPEPPPGLIALQSVPQEPRGAKRVSFADGYKPGQDSDIEEPPAKKRKRSRRYGCAWPCPASHPDHVPLWDALPPPPPPPGSPPPQRRAAPPLHLLRPPPRHGGLLAIPTAVGKFDPTVPMQGFMPPEPPPGLIALQ